MNQTRWTAINIIVGAGISFPLFTSALNISVSKIKVSEKVVVGGKYVLESSTNQTDWVPEPEFVAQAEQFETEVPVSGSGRFFRLKALELPPVTVWMWPYHDTSIFEAAPQNNAGRLLTLAAGGEQGNRTRALLRFDMSPIPVGAQVLNARLELHVVLNPQSEAPASFTLHRVLSECGIGPTSNAEGPWNEGEKGALELDGDGALADGAFLPEPTWTVRHQRIVGHPNIGWCVPGLGPDRDHVAMVSATVSMGGDGGYTFTSSELAADVQFWRDNSSYPNDGWLLKGESEDTPESARRFAAREYPTSDFRPRLIVEYQPPVAPTIQPQNSTPAPALTVLK